MFIIALHAKDIFDEDVHKTEETNVLVKLHDLVLWVICARRH